MDAIIAGLVAILVLIVALMVGEIKHIRQTNKPMVIPAMPDYAPDVDEETEWDLYNQEAKTEYADEFTALFNSYEVKRARNGALMIRSGSSGSYRFAKKG